MICMKRYLTIDQLAVCYGICSATMRSWRKRAQLSTADLHDPAKLAARLLATARNHSPRLERLCDPYIQSVIIEKIEIYTRNLC